MTRLLLKLLLTGLVIAGLAVAYLDTRIVSTFSARMWELPARVYARPLELFVGASLRAEALAHELALLGYRKVSHTRAPGEVARNRQRFEIYTRGFDFPIEREPSRRIIVELAGDRVASLSSHGENIDLMRVDPVQIGGIYASHGEDRLLARLDTVPSTLRGALLAVEDRRFYRHWGFSISGMARALLSNLRSGKVVAGGSTITQQLIKNYYLTPERTIVRKLTELVMAVLVEIHFSKDQILESYINEAYLGQDGPRAVHGFALAARHYFDTPLEQLGLHQQALLVGMIKGPSLYNPLRNPERALARRKVVLEVMTEQGIISAEQAAVAAAMPLGASDRSHRRDSFPAYLDLVRRQLRQEYRQEDLETLGLSIFTSFDPILQRQLERSTANILDAVDPGGELQGAAVVTHFDSGEVAALVGGRQPRFSGFNRALDARRPVGSLLKPAIYLVALEQPKKYSLASVLEDSPLSVALADNSDWQPRNFDHQSHGKILLYQALAQSYNLASARLGLELGLPRLVDMLRRLGLDGELPRVPSLTLGAGEYSPMDMAAMYQTIAAGGFRIPLRSIRDIVDAQGDSLKRYPLEYERTVDLQAMHLLHYALRAVVREGTGRGVYRQLPADFAVAAKTGTTNDGRDSWFAGFSGDLLTVSWIGRDDNGSTGLTGSSGALRLWSDFMAAASRRPLAYRMPDGIETHWIDVVDGSLTGENCHGARMLPFIRGSQPTERSRCAPRPGGVRDWFQKLFGATP